MIRFADLRLDNETLKQALEVLQSGKFINGRHCKEFAEAWASYCHSKYCVPTSSGSSALTISLRYLASFNQFKKHVVVPTYSFAATVHSVIEAGLVPIYCPVDERGLIRQDILWDIINSQDCLSVIVVHLYGQVIELDSELLKKVNVIEDAAQAHGIQEVQGVAACFSFYPAKNLGAAGDAGAIVTNSPSLEEFAYRYTNYGDYVGEKYQHRINGSNMRMDEVQAAILLHKLQFLDEDNRRRIHNAFLYRQNGVESFTDRSFYHQYPIILPDAPKFEEFETGNHYPYTLPDIVQGQRHYIKKDKAKYLAENVLTLPVGPHLMDEQIELISRKVKECYENM